MEEFSIIASSATDAGAVNKTDIGSTFEIKFDNPMMFKSNMRVCTLQVDEATVWWTIPNISANLGNNKFYIEYNAANYVITIPDGLYAVSDLNNALDRELVNATGVSGILNLEADNATQKVSITINVATVQIDFTPADTFRDILGFNSQLVPGGGPTVGSYTQLGDNVAAFNTIEYFLLHTDLISEGIRTNNNYTQTVAQILIDVPPGSQIVYTPFNPPKSDAINLSGAIVDRVRFWLTDQTGTLVDTNGEDFSCRLTIRFLI